MANSVLCWWGSLPLDACLGGELHLASRKGEAKAFVIVCVLYMCDACLWMFNKGICEYGDHSKEYQASSFIAPHLNPLRRGLSLNQKFAILGIQAHVDRLQFYKGVEDSLSGSHTYRASTLTLSHLPGPSYCLKNVKMFPLSEGRFSKQLFTKTGGKID